MIQVEFIGLVLLSEAAFMSNETEITELTF